MLRRSLHLCPSRWPHPDLEVRLEAAVLGHRLTSDPSSARSVLSTCSVISSSCWPSSWPALATLWDNIRHSGANIFTYTAPALRYQFGPVAGLAAGMHLLIAGIAAFGVVLAAASLAGRQLFGWGGELGEHLGRVGLAATLANGAPFLISSAIDLNNRLCEAIGAGSVPRGFDGSPISDNLTTGLLMVSCCGSGSSSASRCCTGSGCSGF